MVGSVPGSGFFDLDGESRSDSLAGDLLTAVIAGDQTLISGESVELRLSAAGSVGWVLVPRGTLLSGKAMLSGERLMVTVTSLRVGDRALAVSLEVLDIDGVPGIRVRGSINRDVSKESAAEGIGSLGVTTFDPSLGGQAAAAGMQAARSLLSRKVRLVRLGLPAGYQVFLRNLKSRL
jgi:conjugative transposon TraM protein